jgi:hypothetical protein
MKLSKMITDDERIAIEKTKVALEVQHSKLLKLIDNVNAVLSNGCSVKLSQ